MQFNLDAGMLVALLLISARIFAWSVVAPPIATAGLPVVVKTVLSVGLALAVLPTVKGQAPALDTASIIGDVVLQVMVGAGLGLVTRILFSAIEAAGSLLDVFGGFSLSAAYDPLSTTTTSIFGRFYGLLCTTLIFATNMHLLIFQGFLRTFQAVPLNSGISLSRLGSALSTTAGELFLGALQIAGPLVVVLFIADIALGVLNRIAPQLNAFSMSFPIKIGLTLLLVGLGFLLMPQTVANIAQRATSVIGQVTG
jgi:flagellar biosynthesis protein FliR